LAIKLIYYNKCMFKILMITCVTVNGCHSNLDTSAHLMNTY